MVEKSDQIKEEIDAQRDELGENLHELERRIRNSADIGAHVDRHPWIALGVAFGAGIAVAALTRRSHPDWDDWSKSYNEPGYGEPRYTESSLEQEAQQANRSRSESKTKGASSSMVRRQARRFSESLDNIGAALMGVAANSLHKFISDSIPGFNDHYERTASERQNMARGHSRDTEYQYPGNNPQYYTGESRKSGEQPPLPQ